MPNVQITLPDVSQSVMRPIVIDIVNQVQEITKITKDARIFFPDDVEKMQQPGSSIDDNGIVNSRDALTTNNRIIQIDVEEDYDQDAIASTAVTYKENNPVFIDKELNVFITPIYVTSNVTINFKYKTQSKTEALRWRDDIRFKISQLRDINLHKLNYHYLVPLAYVELLNLIHKTREETAGYGEDLETYIRQNSTTRLGFISDLSNKTRRLAISETQTRVQGMYGFDTFPEKPARDDSNGTWTISFSYKFNYQRPVACNMKYPVIVHNQLLPYDQLVFENNNEDPLSSNSTFTKSLNVLNYFEQSTINRLNQKADTVVFIPEYDEFVPSQTPPYTSTVFYGLCTFSEDDHRLMLNLEELGDYVIDPDILEFIQKSEYPFINKSYRSILQLNYYRNIYLTNDNSVTCDNNLNIRLTEDANLRQEHRIRLALVTDLSFLDADAIRRLKKFPKAFIAIMSALNEHLALRPEVVPLKMRNYVTESDFQKVVSFIYGYGTNRLKHPLDTFGSVRGSVLEHLRNTQVQINRIQTSFIISKTT